jgi:hypothetical protein
MANGERRFPMWVGRLALARVAITVPPALRTSRHGQRRLVRDVQDRVQRGRRRLGLSSEAGLRLGLGVAQPPTRAQSRAIAADVLIPHGRCAFHLASAIDVGAEDQNRDRGGTAVRRLYQPSDP